MVHLFQTIQVLITCLNRSRLYRKTHPRPRRSRNTRPPRRPPLPGPLRRQLHPPLHQIQGRWPNQGQQLDRRKRHRLHQDLAPQKRDILHSTPQSNGAKQWHDSQAKAGFHGAFTGDIVVPCANVGGKSKEWKEGVCEVFAISGSNYGWNEGEWG